MTEKPIILFDGLCNLCDSSVQFVIRHDPKGIFLFASLQSKTGVRLSEQYHIPGNTRSFILIQEGKAYTRSTAALRVARQLKGVTRLLYGFIIVPPFIRNLVYDLVATNRYNWFGKKDSCMIPSATTRDRFINEDL